ncbi:MAG: aldo/keto reductase, partial [Cytophagaceae bacterium]
FYLFVMEYRKLGKSNITISRIGFGSMSIGKDQEIGIRLIHQAIDSGINFFDTADLYDKGLNEVIVGRALKEIRKDIILATKVGNQWRSDGSGWDWNPRKEYILKAVDESLKRLGIDFIDLYQLHGGTIEDPIDEIIEAFELLVQQGKIRDYGISSIRPNVIREWVKRSSMISVMIQYSLLDRRPEESILELLKQNNIGVLVRGSIAQGLLINKPPRPYLNRGEGEVQKAASRIRNYSANERKASQTALQYVLSHPAVTSAVVGIRTPEQLQEASGVFAVPFLNADEIKDLRQVVSANQYEDHR